MCDCIFCTKCALMEAKERKIALGFPNRAEKRHKKERDVALDLPNEDEKRDREVLSTAAVEAAAETGLFNDDVTIEILCRLPVKSIARCKCVCKHWAALVSGPHFVGRITRRITVSGIFLEDPNRMTREFLPLRGDPSVIPDPRLSFMNIVAWGQVIITQCCNGLILCRRVDDGWGLLARVCYYVVNPITRQHVLLPETLTARSHDLVKVYLVFDPSQSCHYKAVATFGTTAVYMDTTLEIYSSELGSWRLSRCSLKKGLHFHAKCVYWNGMLHWIKEQGDHLISFDVEGDEVWQIPMPPKKHLGSTRACLYLGESGGDMHLIETSDNAAAILASFNIWKMEKDYSGWSVKLHVSLGRIRDLYPHAVSDGRLSFAIMHFVCEGDEQLLLIELPGKMISYHVTKNTSTELCDTDSRPELPQIFGVGDSSDALPYTSTLFSP